MSKRVEIYDEVDRLKVFDGDVEIASCETYELDVLLRALGVPFEEQLEWTEE